MSAKVKVAPADVSRAIGHQCHTNIDINWANWTLHLWLAGQDSSHATQMAHYRAQQLNVQVWQWAMATHGANDTNASLRSWSLTLELEERKVPFANWPGTVGEYCQTRWRTGQTNESQRGITRWSLTAAANYRLKWDVCLELEFSFGHSSDR